MAVVCLVGMKHHDLSGPACRPRAAIVEGLDAAERQSHAIGLVAVQVVGVTAETRRQALQAGVRFVEADLVRRAHAQTFKTVGPRCLIWEA